LFNHPAIVRDAVFVIVEILGPNFGYEYVLRGLEDKENWDFKNWRGVIQGGEPMKVQTLDRFCEKITPYEFERGAFTNVFGMAETVLFVFGSTNSPPRVIEVDKDTLEREKRVKLQEGGGAKVISVGKPDEEVTLCAVDPDSHEKLADGIVGELWLSSVSVSDGYWGWSREENNPVFHAKLAKDPDDKAFLRTGDLGLIYDGDAFICGRIKDMIIIGGRNIYPQDIEESVLVADKRIRPGCVLAFGINAGMQEELVLVVEVRKDVDYRDKEQLKELIDKVRGAVSADHSLACHEVLLLPPTKIPKTTSGKLQRARCAQMWENQELEALQLRFR
jgi:acyl-CoA synthetase (AMP-forming)/AMP-acid ligase II